jgi:hypothetical protein
VPATDRLPTRSLYAHSPAWLWCHSGEEFEILDTSTGQIDLAHASDNINFAVDEFNKRVITVPFNATVAKALAEYIDPTVVDARSAGSQFLHARHLGHYLDPHARF